jgi:imidazolonepropionase-like amidohydrolase
MALFQKNIFFFFLLFTCSITVNSQQQYTLIKAGKLFDAVAGKMLLNQQILINGNVIMAVGEKIDFPQGTKVIDLSTYTVLPGLIESHMHLFYSEPLHRNFTEENIKIIVMEGDALRTLRALKRARSFLDGGVTTVKDLGNSGQYLDVAI